MAHNESDRLKKEYLEQHIEFVKHTLQKTLGTSQEKIWKQTYDLITNKKMSKESILRMHAKLVDLKKRSQQKFANNPPSKQPSNQKLSEKRSVSPIRFPQLIETTSKVTTIIYQTTSTRSSRDPRVNANNKRYPSGEKSKDPQVQSVRNDPVSSKSIELSKRKDKAKTAISEHYKAHYKARNDSVDRNRQRSRMRSRSRSFSISPKRDQRHHENYKRDHHDSGRDFRSQNTHRSSRSFERRADLHHRSSRSEYHNERHETHSRSRYERHSKHVDKRYISTHLPEKGHGRSFSRDHEERTSHKSPSRKVPYKDNANTNSRASLQRQHLPEQKPNSNSSKAITGQQDPDYHSVAAYSHDEQLDASIVSISSDELEDEDDQVDHQKSVWIETHVSKNQSISYHDTNYEQVVVQSTPKFSKESSSKNTSYEATKSAIRSDVQPQNISNQLERKREDRIETETSGRLNRESSLSKKNEEKSDLKRGNSCCTEPLPRSDTPSRMTCPQSKLKPEEVENVPQSTTYYRSSTEELNNTSNTKLNSVKRKDPRLQSDYCKIIEQESQEIIPKPDNNVDQVKAIKKRRMSCYHQPKETLKPEKIRRLSSDGSTHPKFQSSSYNTTPKVPSSYKIPKLTKAVDHKNDASKATTSSSFDDNRLLTELKSFAKKDLPKEKKAEILVSTLKEILGNESFLTIQSILVKKSSDADPIESEKESVKNLPEKKLELNLKPESSVKVKTTLKKELTEKPSVKTPSPVKKLKPKVETITSKNVEADNLKARKSTSNQSAKPLVESSPKHSKRLHDQEYKVSKDKRLRSSFATNLTSEDRKQTKATTSKSQETKKDEEGNDKKRKKLNELDRLHLDINEMHERDGILSGYKPRNCTQAQRTRSSRSETLSNAGNHFKQFKLREFSIPLRKVNVEGTSGTFQLNRSFLLRNPFLKSELEDIVNKLEDEAAEDEMCEEGNISMTSSEDSLTQLPVIEKPKPKKVVTVPASPAKKKSTFKKRSSWSQGMITKKVKKKIIPKDSEDEWEDVKKKSKKKKVTKLKLFEVIKFMNRFEKNCSKKTEKVVTPSSVLAAEKLSINEPHDQVLTPEPQLKQAEPSMLKSLLTVSTSDQTSLNEDSALSTSSDPLGEKASVELTNQQDSLSNELGNRNTIPHKYSKSRAASLEKSLSVINSNIKSFKTMNFKDIVSIPKIKTKKICIQKANQNISFNAEKKLKCDLCSFESMDTGSFVGHLKQSHPLNVWSQYCNICKQTIKETDQSLNSELGHLLTHMTYSVAQPRHFLKIRDLPGDKLSIKSGSSSPSSVPSNSIVDKPNSLALITMQVPSSTPESTNSFTQLFQVKIPAESESPIKVSISCCTTLRPWIKSLSDNKTTLACNEMLKSVECLAALFKCMGNSCSYYSSDKEMFRTHLRLHEQFQAYDKSNFMRCPYCTFMSSTIDEYIDHVHETHGFDLYQCKYCFFRAYNEFSISKQHHRAHHSSEQSCLIEVKPSQVRKASVENEIIRNKNIPEYVPLLKCFICKKASFYVVKSFIKHLETHPENMEIKCIKCGEIMNKNSTIKHFYDCFKFGIYQCVYCKFGTNTFSSIGDHINEKHSNNSPYFCERTLSSNKVVGTGTSNEITIKLIKMFSKTCKRVKMQDKNLINAENVNRLNNNFVAPQASTVIEIDEDEVEPSQFSLLQNQIPSNEITTSRGDTTTSCQLQIQNVMSLFEMPTEKFVDDDIADLELYDFDA